MQLSRFRNLVADLKEDPTLTAQVSRIEVFRLQSGEWLDGDDNLVSDQALRSDLEHTRRFSMVWRQQRSRVAYFPLEGLDAVLAAEFRSSPSYRTQGRFEDLLTTAVRNSSNAWSATHDEATGLLNKSAFDERLKTAIAWEGDDASGAQTGDEVGAIPLVALLALDLDHFKQANDNYGHLYGDVLLQCFAGRLQSAVTELDLKLEGRAVLVPARTGGEEFSVLVAGAVTSEDLDEIAEALRRIVLEPPMPSEHEWQVFVGDGDAGSIRLPHISERRTTVSVGLATTGHVSGNVTVAATLLKSQADLALYRAKAGGRNTVRKFTDIAARYGTVLEHHADTEVVVVDIGRAVGVRSGQEFMVFHPDFAGTKPFTFSDGRTRRRLGDYPRYSCGRIVAFDVQNEISFCRVMQRTTTGLFPVGSALELVPLGSIAHLISSGMQTDASPVVGLASPDGIEATVASMLEANTLPFVAVFSLAEPDALAEKQGIAFVNQVLADLYAEMRDVFPGAHAISQVKPTQLALVMGGGKHEEYITQARACGESLYQRTAQRARLQIGLYSALLKQPKLTGDASKLDAKYALDYALYAAAAPEKGLGDTVLFTPGVASAVIGASRGDQRMREAIADYHRLRSLGVHNAYAENQAALAAHALGDETATLALEAIDRAIQLAPGIDVFRANRGYFLFTWDRRLEAHEAFEQIPATLKLQDVYLGPRALSMFERFKKDPGAVEAGKLETALRAALAAPAAVMKRTVREELSRAMTALVEAGVK